MDKSRLEKCARYKGAFLFGIAFAMFACAVRVRGAMNDLTLDEIVSINGVTKIASILDVFTKLHVDNNHYLNSIWLHLAGAHGNWWGYRIPSIAAGVGTVVLAWAIGSCRNIVTAAMAAFLTAFSYVLILYSDQARGYSCQVFFSFLCYYALEIFLKHRSWKMAVLFSFGAIFGFLSHLDFVTLFSPLLHGLRGKSCVQAHLCGRSPWICCVVSQRPPLSSLGFMWPTSGT